jgi:hypothetical protein
VNVFCVSRSAERTKLFTEVGCLCYCSSEGSIPSQRMWRPLGEMKRNLVQEKRRLPDPQKNEELRTEPAGFAPEAALSSLALYTFCVRVLMKIQILQLRDIQEVPVNVIA